MRRGISQRSGAMNGCPCSLLFLIVLTGWASALDAAEPGCLNSHMHFHVLMTDGVISSDGNGRTEYHPAAELNAADFQAVQTKMRRRGLRWLHRHGHLDSVAVHALDAPDHAGGWSADVSVTIAAWDRHGLERLVRYCARPPLSHERLGRLDPEWLVYSLRKPTVDGRTELILTPLELSDRLAHLVTPPRNHRSRQRNSVLTSDHPTLPGSPVSTLSSTNPSICIPRPVSTAAIRTSPFTDHSSPSAVV